jgi:tRNA-specific 2-thiouridylase
MKIAVAMSGGMDSTAAALLLKEQGNEVLGLHMYLHEYSRQSWKIVRETAQRIGVPMELVDLSSSFEELVIHPFVREYSRGRTPSPCLMCNKMIKMGLLAHHALDQGCERLATGHYARISFATGFPELRRGADPIKDQSYFLAMLTREMLGTLVLPLGSLTKNAVRGMLMNKGLPIYEADESQELCFIRQGTYKDFLLSRGIVSQPGSIRDMAGRELGRHEGIVGFTVGQRRGMGISAAHPLYVIAIDPADNALIVGPKDATFTASIQVAQFNLLRETPIRAGEQFLVKVRSTSVPTSCTVESVMGSTLTVKFYTPQPGVAPGQAAVLYAEDQVVGGGWIEQSTGKEPGFPLSRE